MDTSETYIKMCEKAEEIQAEWKPFNGDYIIQNNYFILPGELQQPVALHFCNDSKLLNFNRKDFIWLPRQDQLQEMVKREDESNRASVRKFVDWCFSIKELYGWSMEQLWLAFVMKKNNKTWDGEAWNLTIRK